eukprot:scpid86696/ scgid19585/ 
MALQAFGRGERGGHPQQAHPQGDRGGPSACVTVVLTVLLVGTFSAVLCKFYVDTEIERQGLECDIKIRDETALLTSEKNELKDQLKSEMNKQKDQLKSKVQISHGCFLHMRTLSFYLFQSVARSKQGKSTIPGKIFNFFSESSDAEAPSSSINFNPEVFENCKYEMDLIEHWIRKDSDSLAQFEPKKNVAGALQKKKEAEKLEMEEKRREQIEAKRLEIEAKGPAGPIAR